MTRKEIIAQLLKEGATQVSDITIKNVTVTPLEQYVRLGLTIDKEVDVYRANIQTKEYELAKTDVIFASVFSITALIKDDDDAAFAANHLIKHPDAMAVILSRAKINIIQETVSAGQEYRNPFASDDSNITIFDHNTIINHVISLKISDFGLKRLDRLSDLMMGYNN